MVQGCSTMWGRTSAEVLHLQLPSIVGRWQQLLPALMR